MLNCYETVSDGVSEGIYLECFLQLIFNRIPGTYLAKINKNTFTEFWANQIAIIVVNVWPFRLLSHRSIKVRRNIPQLFHLTWPPHPTVITSIEWIHPHRITMNMEHELYSTMKHIVIKFQIHDVIQRPIFHRKSHWRKWIRFR